MATTPIQVPEPGTVGDRWRRSRVITASAETGNTVELIEIPAGTYVAEVAIIILVALAGGTPSIDVGDDDAAAGWIATADITETSAGSYRSTAATYAKNGRYYTAKKRISAALSASLSAGSFIVCCRCIDLP